MASGLVLSNLARALAARTGALGDERGLSGVLEKVQP
jgi:hypothetical protein